MIAAHADPQSIYDFPILLEILIAASALLLLLAVTRHRDLGYWSWCLYSKRLRDKGAFCALLVGQIITVGLIAAIVPLTHEVVGIRPTSALGEGFLIAEAILAGWAVLALLPEGNRIETRRDISPRELLILAVRGAGLALNQRSRVCVRPALFRVMDLDEGTRSRVLNSFRDGVSPKERSAADIIATNVMGAWEKGNDERDNAMEALTSYINDGRIAPYGLLGKR